MHSFNMAVVTTGGIKKIPVSQFNQDSKVILYLHPCVTLGDSFRGIFVCFDKSLDMPKFRFVPDSDAHPLVFVDTNMAHYGNKLVYKEGCTGFSVICPFYIDGDAVDPHFEWEDDSLEVYLSLEEIFVLLDFLKTLYSLKSAKELQPLASSLVWSEEAELVILRL